jgi:putative ABC transport system permease protein
MSRSEILSAARMALATIREHKMRSFLTVLGVIIGTGTVIAVGSIITGMDASIANIFRSFGPSTVIAFKFKIGFRFNVTREEFMRKPLTVENARAIFDRCAACQYVSPYLFPDFRSIHKARYKGNEIYDIDMGGTEATYAAGGTVMQYGRFLSEADNRHHLPVCVIGEDLRKSFFPNLDPVGKKIEVDGHELEVIGAMERPAANFPGQEDRRILLPYFTMKKMYPAARENMLVIVAYEGRVPEAMDEIRGVLRQERRLKPGQPDNFDLTTSEQMVEEFRNMMSATALVMVILSSIGLLVGGVGVMNIMLVSVTERTKEIGVRKAVGARRSDIIAQFLTEATVLTGAGGLFGILLGWLLSLGAKLVFPALPTMVPMWALVMGVTVSVGVGLFFGIWPAAKAARLDPVEALRYE